MLDFGEAVVPRIEINIRRRSERGNEFEAGKAQAGRVTGECGSGGLVKIADVVRSVARRVSDFNFAARNANAFAAD